jgi:hypothetical protein
MDIKEFAAAVSESGHAPATETEITEFEALLGHALPKDFREFLSISGGGFMELQPSFYWPDGNWAGRVHTIGGLRNDDPDYSLKAQWSEPAWKLPAGFLWILRDTGGNPIVLALSGPEVGQVFFVDHEVAPDDDEWDGTLSQALEYGYLLPLASSFAAFVSGIDANA